MKTTIALIMTLVIIPLGSYSQTLVSNLKSKYFGKYVGAIPSYNVSADTIQYTADEVAVMIQLSAKDVVKKVGRIEQRGTYKVLFKDKKYYVIELSFPETALVEKWMLKEKPKEMVREGVMNQPAIRLKRGR